MFIKWLQYVKSAWGKSDDDGWVGGGRRGLLTKLAAAVCNVMRLRRFAAASAPSRRHYTPHSVVGYAHHSINVVLVERLGVAAGTKLCNPISTSPLTKDQKLVSLSCATLVL